MKRNYGHSLIFFVLLFTAITSCKESSSSDNSIATDTTSNTYTIFFFNDPHAQLDNFGKVKDIVDKARDSSNVLLVCAGDLFSGSPYVDQYDPKGFPIIDLMNKTGVKVATIGNHDFDYGISILKDRMSQAQFDWLCANVNTEGSELPQPKAYTTLKVGDLKITFLGLLETSGKPGFAVPSTHPWRVKDLTFQHYYDMVEQYKDLKEKEGADLYIALSHLGSGSDRKLANEFPYFDAIIGGHSHEMINETVNDIPIVQAGSYLKHLGKITFTTENDTISDFDISFINLEEYADQDPELEADISNYLHSDKFDEVIGESESDLDITELGCFYTTALKDYMHVDASFQNHGGIRSDIDEGDITTLEIYNMDPFNNGSAIYTMTVEEIKDFFQETGANMYVSGIELEQNGHEITVYDENGNVLDNSTTLKIGINDYIPAVYESYFPLNKADIQPLTTAETIIQYLETIDSTIEFEGCNQSFDYTE